MDDNRAAKLWVVWAALWASLFQGLTPDPNDLASPTLLRIVGSLCANRIPNSLPPADAEEPVDIPGQTSAAPVGSGWVELCQRSMDHACAGIETVVLVLDPFTLRSTFLQRSDFAHHGAKSLHMLCRLTC